MMPVGSPSRAVRCPCFVAILFVSLFFPACWGLGPIGAGEGGAPDGGPRSSIDAANAVDASEPELEPETLVIRSPAPGRRAPVNLRYLTVSRPAKLSSVSLLGSIALVRGEVRIPLENLTRPSDRELLLGLPRREGACAPLCPGAVYVLEAEGSRGAPGPRGRVMTGTVADSIPPTVTSTRVVDEGGRIQIELEFSEPVIVRAELHGSGLGALSLPSSAVAMRSIVVAPSPELLLPETEYRVSVEAFDIAGNETAPLELAFRTSARVDALISEVVAVPLHDWNDHERGRTPFDASPGLGPVTESDAWVELVNLSPFSVDLATAGLSLRVLDGSPTETRIDARISAFFGDGGSPERWWPGEALVFHPRGSFSRRGFVLELWNGPNLLDRVVVGDVPARDALRAVPPDTQHEALARTGEGTWSFCVPTPGSPEAPDDCL